MAVRPPSAVPGDRPLCPLVAWNHSSRLKGHLHWNFLFPVPQAGPCLVYVVTFETILLSMFIKIYLRGWKGACVLKALVALEPGFYFEHPHSRS